AAIAHYEAAVDDDALDVGGFGGVDEIRIDVVERYLIERIAIDDQQIRALSRLEGADFIPKVQRLRTANRGELKSLLRRDHFRITAEDFVQLRHRVHLFPHVQVVV